MMMMMGLMMVMMTMMMTMIMVVLLPDHDNDNGGSCTGGTSAPTFFDRFDASASLRGLRRTSPLASRQSGIELRVSFVLEFRRKRTRGNVLRV